MDILIDSSVWISADNRDPVIYPKLHKIIHDQRYTIFSALPIQMEVCQGVKSEAEFDVLWGIFETFPRLEITPDIWKQTGHNFIRCRRKGVTIASVDCLIATVAEYYQVKLWTKDSIFPKIASILSFQLFDS